MRRRLTVIVLLGVYGALAVGSIGTAGAARETSTTPSASHIAGRNTVWIESVQTTKAAWNPWLQRTQYPAGTPPPTTRYRWAWIWIQGWNETRETLTIQCKLDKAAWAACAVSDGTKSVDVRARKVLKGLAPGLHTIRVRAVDPAGNVVPNPLVNKLAVFSWFVSSIAVPAPPPPPSKTPPSLDISVDSRGLLNVEKLPALPPNYGATPRTLKAGVYDVFLRDRTSVHNIHLVGVGINRRTSVAGTTVGPPPRDCSTCGEMIKVVWQNVTLRPGKLSVYSDRAPTKRISITVS